MPKYKTLTKKLTPIVLGVGIPASLRSFSQYLQQVIDTMFVGQYDSESLLAISSVIIPFWMFESIWIGVTSATTVMIAQRIGAKKTSSATKVAQLTFLISGISAISYFVFWQNMSGAVAYYMNLQGKASIDATTYIKTLSFLYLFRFVGIGAPSSILEALGNTRILMIATIAQTITNIALDPILIWGWGAIPELGIQGAAYATIIAELVACIIISSYFWRHNYLKLKTTPITPFQFDAFERFKLGMPMTVEIMVWSLSTSTIISMLNNVLPLGGAIFNVGFLLSDVSYRLLYGFDIANMSLIGRAFGAKRKDRMVAILRAVTKSKWILGLIIMAFVYTFRQNIVQMFTNDEIIIRATIDNFEWIIAMTFVIITIGIHMSTLNGMGYARYVFYIALIVIPLRVILTYFVLYYTDFGITGVWGVTILEEGSRVIITYIVRQRVLEKYWHRWTHT